MRFYQEVLKLGCFSLDEAAAICNNKNTAKSAIYSLKTKGLVESVKRNLYAVISMESKTPVCSPYEIASHITKSSYVSHHAAFEYYGVANQVFNYFYVSSDERFNDFYFDGKKYCCVASQSNLGVVTTRRGIRVTDAERTILDNIKDISKIGGLEETLRCLAVFPVADEEKLVQYLKAFNNRFLWQKAGFILKDFAQQLKLSDRFFELCKTEKGKSTRYLIPHEANTVYSKEWSLIVPSNYDKIMEEGEDLDV